MRALLPWLQRAVGAMDTLTGLLLITAPRLTLQWMGIPAPPEQPVLLSWIGVFVLAVGLSYFLPGPLPANRVQEAAWRMQWKITAVVRLAVACFVCANVLFGRLEAAWLSVAVTDFTIGALQAVGLQRNWLKGGADQ